MNQGKIVEEPERLRPRGFVMNAERLNQEKGIWRVSNVLGVSLAFHYRQEKH